MSYIFFIQDLDLISEITFNFYHRRGLEITTSFLWDTPTVAPGFWNMFVLGFFLKNCSKNDK